ncbi:Rv3235 family protein [Acrocarpospora catenulata]|uniref:Rv3235 family protein n=1 Tax=Acrocarpospora catenulata TaxID=2836182 RepID=UPI002023A003|nr:Rv3235 family protein [Acrocarpospora catenulata]
MYDLPPVHGSLALAHRPVRARGPLILGSTGNAPEERRLRWLGQALAEILAGRRPPESVQERLTERAYAELVRAGKMIDTSRPPLAGPPHVQSPREGAIEMCLLVHCGHRSRVLAVRLERYGVQWLVTDVETA